MNRDLDYVLNYMVKYTKDRFMQDSEPMLNHKDIEIVLKHIYKLEKENKQLKEEIKKIAVDNLAQINIERESEFVSLILKIIQEKEEIIYKAIECIKNRNTTKSKKERFMSGETTLEKVLEILGDKE